MTDAASLNDAGRGSLPGLLGVNVTGAGEGWVEAELAIRSELMAPNGFLHAGTIVTLADTCCGYGCVRALPEGASGFTTVELKTNFLGAAREGVIAARAEAVHLGRKTLALFRCTQMVLWPKA
jgi:uncharacterized protein (TIGR00369 family)